MGWETLRKTASVTRGPIGPPESYLGYDRDADSVLQLFSQAFNRKITQD
jgi:hypothetical protein